MIKLVKLNSKWSKYYDMSENDIVITTADIDINKGDELIHCIKFQSDQNYFADVDIIASTIESVADVTDILHGVKMGVPPKLQQPFGSVSKCQLPDGTLIEVGTTWRNVGNDNNYEIMGFVNVDANRTAFPLSVIYQDMTCKRIFTKKISEWTERMTRVEYSSMPDHGSIFDKVKEPSFTKKATKQLTEKYPLNSSWKSSVNGMYYNVTGYGSDSTSVHVEFRCVQTNAVYIGAVIDEFMDSLTRVDDAAPKKTEFDNVVITMGDVTLSGYSASATIAVQPTRARVLAEVDKRIDTIEAKTNDKFKSRDAIMKLSLDELSEKVESLTTQNKNLNEKVLKVRKHLSKFAVQLRGVGMNNE